MNSYILNPINFSLSLEYVLNILAVWSIYVQLRLC